MTDKELIEKCCEFLNKLEEEKSRLRSIKKDEAYVIKKIDDKQQQKNGVEAFIRSLNLDYEPVFIIDEFSHQGKYICREKIETVLREI